MIDTNNKTTQSLSLDEQPGKLSNVTGLPDESPHGVVFPPCPTARKPRGRPATGKAMTPAEKQRAYRERQKAKSGYVDPATVEEIKRMQEEITSLRKALIARDATGLKKIDELREENEKLKKQLSSRYEKPSKGLSYRKLTEAAFDQVKTNEKSADVKAAKDWSFGTYLLWDYLAPSMNVQEAAYQADNEKLRKMVGLGPKDPK